MKQAPDSAAADWTPEHAQALRAALGPRAGEEDGPFGFCQLATRAGLNVRLVVRKAA